MVAIVMAVLVVVVAAVAVAVVAVAGAVVGVGAFGIARLSKFSPHSPLVRSATSLVLTHWESFVLDAFTIFQFPLRKLFILIKSALPQFWI